MHANLQNIAIVAILRNFAGAAAAAVVAHSRAAHAFSLKCNLGLSKSIQPLISHAVSEHTQVENRPAFTRTCIK